MEQEDRQKAPIKLDGDDENMNGGVHTAIAEQ